MLAPDIFKIKPSTDNTHFFYSNFNSDIIKKDITNHYFNHGVVAVFPDTMQISSKVKEALLHDSDYYLFSDFPLACFIDYPFIEAFVKKGEVTALSVDTMLDVGNCCCLTPSGCLVLSLQRNYFLELGIEQGPAVTIKKIDNRFLIIIDLQEKCFHPKKKNFQRICNRLKAVNLRMDVIMNWEPEDMKVCPSSIASYFHGKGIDCYECKLNYEENRNYEVLLPKFNTPHSELFEWLGINAVGGPDIDEDENVQEYLSTYEVPEGSEVIGQVLTIKWVGFISSKRILKLLETMREYLSMRTGLPWVGLHIHGFDDSPVSWKLQPHKFTTRGDNSYTLIFNRDGDIKVCKSFTSQKKMY